MMILTPLGELVVTLSPSIWLATTVRPMSSTRADISFI